MWTSRDRLKVKDLHHQQSANYRAVALLIPTETAGSSYDPFADSPIDPSDGSVTAAGKTIAWKLQVIHARVASPSILDYRWPAWAQVGITAGDLMLFIELDDSGAIQSVIDESDAYLFLDGQTYRPLAIYQSGIFYADQRVVHCRKSTARVRATGW